MSTTAAAAPVLHLAVYEGAGSQPLASGERAALLSVLLARGHQVSVCGPTSGEIACSRPHLLVLARFAGSTPEERTDPNGVMVRFQDIDGKTPEAVLAVVQSAEAALGSSAPGSWKPWFPVIDYDRCTNCMQCLSFCLFDVYGVSKTGKLEVQEPTNCKTNCPACSRVCPEVAIVFPKYKAGPINGDVINADDLRREHMKVDISALLGGDIYQALRDRSERAKSRFSKERDSERALKERMRCLDKLKGQLDIPAEVLSSLPDLAAIAAKKAEKVAQILSPSPVTEAHP
jgi:Pyruvate/2-oxoacid:ferredoxin oxidoreductase delta subunit